MLTQPNSYTDAEAMWFENDSFSASERAVYHEYGHAVMTTAYDYGGAPDPAFDSGQSFTLEDGCHWHSTKTNIGFALSEGWAIYMEAINLGQWTEDSWHTSESGPCGPYGQADQMDGHRVEGSITNILWNATAEGANDTTVSVPFDTIMTIFEEDHPQHVWDIYEGLAPEVDNETALDQLFLDQGVDVLGPDISLAASDLRRTTTPKVSITGTAVDQHTNMSRIQYRVANGADPSENRGWQTITGANQTQFSTSFFVVHDNNTVTIRATDRFGNNETHTVTVFREDNLPAINGTTPQDVTGDGLYADFDGDGKANVFDVITYYENRQSNSIRDHPGFFDYDGDGTAGTVFDAIALYEKLSS